MEDTLPLRERRAFYSPGEVATLARVDPKTVMTWIHERKLTAVQLSPRIYRIPLGSVIKLLYPSMKRRARIVRRSGRILRPGARERLPRARRAS